MNVLDIFSGIGGFSAGLERAGMRTVALCECDPFCRTVLAKHWVGIPCYPDVRGITSARLAADGISVDLVCGGFPCQDVSVAGRGRGIDGERSGLWREFCRIIADVSPDYVLVENVAHGRGRWLPRILGDLAALRYDAEWHCIPASWLGANHERDRCFVIAYPDSKSLRLEQQRLAPRFSAALQDALEAVALDSGSEQWRGTRPELCRVDDGISPALDGYRFRALGNAIVPQVAEAIGRAIVRVSRF